MRVVALVVRAGAVVAVAAFAFSLVIHGAPTPVADRAQAAEAPRVAAVKKQIAKPTRPAAPAGVVTIAAVGDIVMGSTPNLPPEGGRTFFDGVATDLAGDVVLGNLEGTLSSGGSSKCRAGSTNCFSFQTPPSYGRWLKKAGFTVLNLANNHAFDFGPSG